MIIFFVFLAHPRIESLVTRVFCTGAATTIRVIHGDVLAKLTIRLIHEVRGWFGDDCYLLLLVGPFPIIGPGVFLYLVGP